jgi:micrococcal nuclease
MKTILFLLFATFSFAADFSFRDIPIPMLTPSTLYFYKATPFYIVDGDTCDMEVDLGFETSLKTRFRLYGIDAWETKGTEKDKGLKAKEFVEKSIKNKPCMIVSIKDKRDKYGRWLAIILVPVVDGTDGDYWILNQSLVENGHAIYADY